MAKTTGKRPRPTVARNHSASYNTDNTGRAPGKSNSKTPTGSRPRPSVAKNTPPAPALPGATRKAIRRFPMPTPLRNWATRGAGKRNGGS
jgi:hypothetical protein